MDFITLPIELQRHNTIINQAIINKHKKYSTINNKHEKNVQIKTKLVLIEIIELVLILLLKLLSGFDVKEFWLFPQSTSPFVMCFGVLLVITLYS
jgi:hypothetical protein